MLNGPEARHGTVINAVRRAGHALRHSCLHELVVKCPVGILEPSIAMEQGVRVWIGFHGIIKGFVNQWIVIAFAEHIGHDAPVAKVEVKMFKASIFATFVIPVLIWAYTFLYKLTHKK